MQRTAVLVTLGVALSTPLGAQAQAAQALPASSYQEAATGTYQEQYDDYGSEVTVLPRKRLALTLYTGNEEEGDVRRVFFNTRRGSTFFVSACDDSGERLAKPVQVSRQQFLKRVRRTRERSITFDYDAERNTGVFTVSTGYVDAATADLLPCPPR